MIMEELYQSIRSNDIEGAREICFRRKDELSLNFLQNKRMSVISFAVKSKCSLELITILLETGFNPDIPILFSPLKYAISKKDMELATLLIKHGAIITSNILAMIIKRRMDTLIDLVMDAKFEQIEAKKGNKITALAAAMKSGRVDLVQKILIEIGPHITTEKYKCRSRNRVTPTTHFISSYLGKCDACEYEGVGYIHFHCDETTGFNILIDLSQKSKSNGPYELLHDLIHYGESNATKTTNIFEMYLKYLEETDSTFDMNYMGNCHNKPIWSSRQHGLLTCSMFQRQEQIVRFLCLRGANLKLLYPPSIIRLDHFNEREKFMKMMIHCGLSIQTVGPSYELLDSEYHNLPWNYDTTGVNFSEYLTHTMEDCHEVERLERVMELYDEMKRGCSVLSLKYLARIVVTQKINLRALSRDESVPTNIMSLIRINGI